MGKPKCALCSREINHNEHFFIAMGARTLCRDCGVKIRGRKNEICGVGTDADSSSKDSN